MRNRSGAPSTAVVDGLLVAGCLVLTAMSVKASWSVLPLPVIAAAGLAGSVAQWWRRRMPVTAAVAGAAAYALAGNPGPLLVGLYSAAAYAPRRRVLPAAVAAWAGTVGWSWIDEGRLDADDVVFPAAGVVLVVVAGLFVASQRALRLAWQDRAERADAERLLRDEQARAAERTRIAREMHDILAHKVSMIALHAGALEMVSAGAGQERTRQSAGFIRVTAREAMEELRVVLGVLQAPAGADPGDPFADLVELVRAAREAGQSVDLDDRAGALPPRTARVVHRVVQEGLTNARKHAPVAAVTVIVDRGDGGAVTVTVTNTAGGGAPLDLPGSGSGLVGLAERLRLVGGTLRSGPLGSHGSQGGGWRLSAEVPWLDQQIEPVQQSGVRGRPSPVDTGEAEPSQTGAATAPDEQDQAGSATQSEAGTAARSEERDRTGSATGLKEHRQVGTGREAGTQGQTGTAKTSGGQSRGGAALPPGAQGGVAVGGGPGGPGDGREGTR